MAFTQKKEAVKRLILLVVGILICLIGCQKKETSPPSPFANRPTRQAFLSKLHEGMSIAEVKAVLGPEFGAGGGSGNLERVYSASDGTLVLNLQNYQLIHIISCPRAKGSMNSVKSRIRSGMSREQTLTTIGYPDSGNSTFDSNGMSGFVSGTYLYYLDDGAININFQQGKVQGVMESPGAKNDIGQDIRR